MKLTSFSVFLAILAMIVLGAVFRMGLRQFDLFPRDGLAGGGEIQVPEVAGSEGPSRLSLEAWSEKLRLREEAVAAAELAQGRIGDRERLERGGSSSRTRAASDPRLDDEPEEQGLEAPLGLEEIEPPEIAQEEATPPADAEAYPVFHVPGGDPALEAPGVTRPIAIGDRVPLSTTLPEAMFEGTKRPLKLANLESVEVKQSPLLVPRGLENLARDRPVWSSELHPVIGDLGYVTDGAKGAADGNYVELGPQVQWVQIDLEQLAEVYGVWLWHFHKTPRAYIDVVVQLSNDPSFSSGSALTIYNADHDNSLGFGVGRDKAYVDTNLGRVVDARGVEARYVRLYSNGNTANEMNHYTEVEVWGRR